MEVSGTTSVVKACLPSSTGASGAGLGPSTEAFSVLRALVRRRTKKKKVPKKGTSRGDATVQAAGKLVDTKWIHSDGSTPRELKKG